jgi:hypothetical protein
MRANRPLRLIGRLDASAMTGATRIPVEPNCFMKNFLLKKATMTATATNRCELPHTSSNKKN